MKEELMLFAGKVAIVSIAILLAFYINSEVFYYGLFYLGIGN